MGGLSTDSEHLRTLVSRLSAASVAVWIDGGWGVDALLGRQHRSHEDLDLVVEISAIPRVLNVLAQLDYGVVEDHLPTRVVWRDTLGRQVDLHPVTFDADGTGWQARASPDGTDCEYPAEGFTIGVIDGEQVPCLSPELQLAHHLGYEPRPHDFEDMRRLARRYGLRLPPPYGDSRSQVIQRQSAGSN